MTTLAIDIRPTSATNVEITEESLIVDLEDGRTIAVPLAWYPRLLHASSAERNNWRLMGKGKGIHWPDLDEDISVENILLGNASDETQRSFKRWLEERRGLGDGASGDRR